MKFHAGFLDRGRAVLEICPSLDCKGGFLILCRLERAAPGLLQGNPGGRRWCGRRLATMPKTPRKNAVSSLRSGAFFLLICNALVIFVYAQNHKNAPLKSVKNGLKSLELCVSNGLDGLGFFPIVKGF